ncbi:MAG: NTP transferase domain-containing protein [Deltaproteobacteria bacterium]|nr:NTP transferase domain-containing protein [Deltaproteobacteria bacterium]
MIEQAVILAGGRGERLKPLTDHVPKPMAPILGVPFLDYLLALLEQRAIKRVLLLVGYKHEVIQERYGTLRKDGFSVEFSIGGEEDLTGRRVLNAFDRLESRFLLLYGDNYWPLRLEPMWDLYRRTNARLVATVFRNRQGTAEYGFENNVQVGSDGRVLRYDKSRKSPALNGVDIGFFLVEKSCLDPRMIENVSFEETILPPLVGMKDVFAYQTDEEYHYITTLDDLRRFEVVVREAGIMPLSWTNPVGEEMRGRAAKVP